ncbi:hypothetical protein [Pararhizobium sp. PWRC1-1]|uniref:hypothetical protein n=1 Tax=Pararhizobium sp. PWRC1-1 TaxID=2804566 RepID=UPI003CF2A56C
MKLRPPKRFDLRKNPSGTWTVFDVFTGKPAAVNDIVLNRLDEAQAGKWVTRLNLEFAKRAGGRIH